LFTASESKNGIAFGIALQCDWFVKIASCISQNMPCTAAHIAASAAGQAFLWLLSG
jgi:hypothetical protein